MDRFPEDFLWGAATSAFQTEGSRDADGSGPSVWDVFARTPGALEGGADGSRACDSYRRWADDVALVGDLHLGAYRFSVGWSRVMPDGHTVNPAALDHYEAMIDAMLAAGIEPVVTLNHWDMPQALMSDDGWAGRSTTRRFADYARAVANRVGDRVSYWITQNEPWIIQVLGYQRGIHAPGVTDLAASLRAGHHVLLGHGLATDAIRDAAPRTQVGVALSLFPCDPATGSPEDRAAAWASDGFVNRWYLDPLYGRGYPVDTRGLWEQVVGEDVVAGVVRDGDQEAIAGRMDFLGVNYYTRRVCAAAPKGHDRPFPWRVTGPVGDVTRTDEGWEVAPASFEHLLERLWVDYGARIMITESGCSYGDGPSPDGRIHDVRRISYLSQHLHAVLAARRSGVDVFGYFAWSLLDNLEWALGYRPRFGLVHVDYPTGRRIPKDSAHFYAAIAASGTIPTPPEVVGAG